MQFQMQVKTYGLPVHSKEYHTNVEVVNTVIDSLGGIFREDIASIRRKHGPVIAKMAQDLLSIEGMGYIFVKNYSVSVSMDYERGYRRWNNKIDEIVEKALRALYAEKNYTKKVVEDSRPSTWKSFHPNFEISKSHIEHFTRPLGGNFTDALMNVGFPGYRLIQDLFKLDGVTEVWAHPYELTVIIGEAFKWDEVDDEGKTLTEKVEGLFQKHYGSDIAFVEKN